MTTEMYLEAGVPEILIGLEPDAAGSIWAVTLDHTITVTATKEASVLSQVVGGFATGFVGSAKSTVEGLFYLATEADPRTGGTLAYDLAIAYVNREEIISGIIDDYERKFFGTARDRAELAGELTFEALMWYGPKGVSKAKFLKRLGGARTATPRAIARRLRKPSSHHLLSNKNRKWTPRYKEIADRYGLDLDEPWNMIRIPQAGRHCTEYLKWSLDEAFRASLEAGPDKAKFLKLFRKYVRDEVRRNPDMIWKDFWKGRR